MDYGATRGIQIQEGGIDMIASGVGSFLECREMPVLSAFVTLKDVVCDSLACRKIAKSHLSVLPIFGIFFFISISLQWCAASSRARQGAVNFLKEHAKGSSQRYLGSQCLGVL